MVTWELYGKAKSNSGIIDQSESKVGELYVPDSAIVQYRVVECLQESDERYEFRTSKSEESPESTANTASMQCPFAIVERFADNGEHSHWDLINKNSGTVEWSQHA